MTIRLTPILDFITTLLRFLWLSVTSIDFYQQVFTRFRGYGLRYLFTISAVASLIISIIFLSYINLISGYLKNSQELTGLEAILDQIPNLKYDGAKISTDTEEPISVTGADGAVQLLIDPENNTLPSHRAKVPIFLSKEAIGINFFDSGGKISNSFAIKYSQIFNNAPTIITKETIKASLAAIIDKMPRAVIYLILPVITVMLFISCIIDKIFLILIIFLFFKFKDANSKPANSIRIVVFSSGAYSLLQFLWFLNIPYISHVLWAVQTWSTTLMIIALVRLRRR